MSEDIMRQKYRQLTEEEKNQLALIKSVGSVFYHRLVDIGDSRELSEVKRTYIFDNDKEVVFAGIVQVRVSDNHTHFLEANDGKKYIVRNTWLALEIDGQWIDP